MQISGTVEKVRRRPTPHGSLYLTVTVGGTPWKYLDMIYNPIPKVGDQIEIDAMPMIGDKKVNICGVRVKIGEKIK